MSKAAPAKTKKKAPAHAFDAAKAEVASRDKQAYAGFVAERRASVCSAKNPKAFAADPSRFVYTAEHCYAKGEKGAKGAKGEKGAKGAKGEKGAPSYDDEISAIQVILDNEYPLVLKNGRATSRMPRGESRAPHEALLKLTGLMMMPYYRSRYPNPSTRYTHVSKGIKTTQRFRVLSQVLMSISAPLADPAEEKVVRVLAGRTPRGDPVKH
jgi:hypothetical protein